MNSLWLVLLILDRVSEAGIRPCGKKKKKKKSALESQIIKNLNHFKLVQSLVKYCINFTGFLNEIRTPIRTKMKI